MPLELADDIGIMFRYTGAGDYYRLSLNARYGFTRLEKRTNDLFTPLGFNTRGYQPGQPIHLKVMLSGPQIHVEINGELIFSRN